MRALPAVAGAWRRGQAGWPRRFVVAQFPNAPLIVALLASLLTGPLIGRAEATADAVHRLALFAWAYLELADGANWFRRLLGAAVAVLLFVRLGSDLT